MRIRSTLAVVCTLAAIGPMGLAHAEHEGHAKAGKGAEGEKAGEKEREHRGVKEKEEREKAGKSDEKEREHAADDEKDLRAAVLKLADAVEKNDEATAKKLVDQLKKQDLEEVMTLMKPPAKNKDAIDIVKEGIETKVIALAKKATDVPKNAPAYEKMGNVIAAIAEVAAVKCPVEKKQGEKDPKDWATWVKEMKEGGKELAAAAKAKDAKKVNAAAKKINGACSSCHGVFRD